MNATRSKNQFARPVAILGLAACLALLAACNGSSNDNDDDDDMGPPPGAETSDAPPPDTLPAEFVHPTGNAQSGMDVFRFETFGNENFWTTAMQLPQGIAEAGVTPLQALQLGLSVNFDALNAPTQAALGAALEAVLGGADPNDTAFGDPAVTLSLINQNAVIGVVVFDPNGVRKPLGNTGSLDIAAGDKVGLTCAVCHAITDDSVLAANEALGTRGSVGSEVDGPTANGLDVGTILAAAKNSLAYYPMLQVRFDTLGGATIGRGNFAGLQTGGGVVPSEAEADAYLTGSGPDGRFYPVGQFDAFPEGIGNPLHIAPFFRTDLAAPWGIDGAVLQLQDFNNTVFTVSLDPTSLLTPGGRFALNKFAGPAGDELAADYETVLRATGVVGADQPLEEVIPFVEAMSGFEPATAQAFTGRRVDDTKLLDLNAYLDSLPSPAAGEFDANAATRGREIFRTVADDGGGGCTACHQVDPNRFVPPNVIAMETMYPGYAPTVILDRPAPLDAVANSQGPSPFFDDRMIVLDASRRGEVRGTALPLLLDLGRKTSLLHDDEVRGASFDEAANLLLDPARGANNAHPFFIEDAGQRQDVVEFLKSLSADG